MSAMKNASTKRWKSSIHVTDGGIELPKAIWN